MSPKAMILAAGKGTRLGHLTSSCPKPMLPVAGIPVLESIVSWLRSYGIREIIINLHHSPETVSDYFGDGARLGVHIEYSIEQKLLGTAGAVKKVESQLLQPFFVCYGDVLSDADLSELWRAHASHGREPHMTLAIHTVPNPSECGIVKVDPSGRVQTFIEKPSVGTIDSSLANAGIIVMDAELLPRLPVDTCLDFGKDVIPALLQDGVAVFGWPLPQGTYLRDMGTTGSYERALSEWPTERARRFLRAQEAV